MTGIWRGAWHIARYELRTSWYGLLFTLLLCAYVAVMGLPLIDAVLTGEFGKNARWAVDLILFCVLPQMGFLMNRSAFRYWQDDTYTKKLALWQTMPIRVEQIVAGRLLLLLLTAFPTGLLYFGLQYAFLDSMRDALDPGAYLNYALAWFGYSLICGVTYVYMELGFPGKVYLAICFAYIPLYGLITLAIWLAGGSAVTYTIESAQAGDWLLPLVVLAVGAVVMAAGSILIKRRIHARSLWN